MRLRAAIKSLPDHPWLDRVVRGRVWIPLLGVMLAGIVAMQVEMLKLGASVGRSLQRTTALQSRNEQLRASVASLADEQRIERMAAGMGMLMPAPDGVGFLAASSGTRVQQAIANLHAPNQAAFLALSTTNGAVAGSAGSPGASGGGTSTGGSTSATGISTSTGTISAGGGSGGAAGTSGGSTATSGGTAGGTSSTGAGGASGANGATGAGAASPNAGTGGASASGSGGASGLPATAGAASATSGR